MDSNIRWLDEVGRDDVAIVGGKNASLGEMIRALGADGIRVPGGFAITASGYRHFIAAGGLQPVIDDHLVRLRAGEIDLATAGRAIRAAIVGAPWPAALADEVGSAYESLCTQASDIVAVAVRSSATAEDLPDASFAGQQDTYLHVSGTDAVLDHCRRCFGSLYTDRAITYRRHQGFDDSGVSMSVCVQRMVRSESGSAGTMFTLDTETGFPDVVMIDSSWGLGESVVGGFVTPDAFRVFKPLLDDESIVPIIDKRLGAKETQLVLNTEGAGITERRATPAADRDRFSLSEPQILQLARWAVRIEAHYGRPMDIEWALDGVTEELFVTQARPETVHARRRAASTRTWALIDDGEVLVEGAAVGHAIASGRARVLLDPADAGTFEDGEVLVTSMTDPDWMPIMERASAIVTDRGGRTSHAAIISRELGLPAIVGCGTATEAIANGREVTVSTAEGDRGRVYAGLLGFRTAEIDVADLPVTKTEIMTIVGSPQTAFRWWRVPSEGVGLARMEFIVNSAIRVHPMALLDGAEVPDPEIRRQIGEVVRGYPSGEAFFVDRLSRAMAGIAAAVHPHPAIVRMSDFKSNEYAQLIGGAAFEPAEHNPMIGFRGASRYYSDRYRGAFALECRALKRAREVIGLSNIVPMIPFCRTPWEADRVIEVMADNGLVRGQEGLAVYMMVEVPSNVILAEQFAERFDGFSIGSNDLTQLTLGIDRDCAELAHLFDARDESVRHLIETVITVANRTGTKIGLCGQAPSDHPEFARFLVACGIDSIAVNPDALVEVRHHVAAAEASSDRPTSAAGEGA